MNQELEQRARAHRFAQALVASGDLRSTFDAREVARAFSRRLASLETTVPLLRTGYVEPTWLRDLTSVYERAELAGRGEGPPVFATFSGTSQTGKSGLGEVAIARMIARNPGFFVATLSYGRDLTLPRSRRIRDDVTALGVELRDDSAAVEHWTTRSGGGLLATGIGGPVTGQPGLVLIDLDDPYKDEDDANSAAVNASLRSFYDGVILTRLGARTSVIVKFARWATNDLIGYIKERDKEARAKCPACASGAGDHTHHLWEHYNVPAIDAAGEPIPKIPGKDRAFYAKQRAGMDPRKWAALMMGDPRPLEGRLFRGSPPTYEARPPSFVCIRIGVDFAYSSSTKADHNAAVVVGKTRDRYYVLRVVRRQCESPVWAGELKALRAAYPTATFHAYIGGTELGPVAMLAAAPYHLRVAATTTRADKYARAQSTAGHWNGNEEERAEAQQKIDRGELVVMPPEIPRRIYLPASATWDVSGFIERTLDFSGADGGVDDEQDALVAAIDACGPPAGPAGPTTQRTPYRSEADRLGDLI